MRAWAVQRREQSLRREDGLSIVMAQAGKRVLLVDTDLRRARLHKTFGLDRTTGITNVLIGDMSLNDRPSELPGPKAAVDMRAESPQPRYDDPGVGLRFGARLERRGRGDLSRTYADRSDASAVRAASRCGGVERGAG